MHLSEYHYRLEKRLQLLLSNALCILIILFPLKRIQIQDQSITLIKIFYYNLCKNVVSSSPFGLVTAGDIILFYLILLLFLLRI